MGVSNSIFDGASGGSGINSQSATAFPNGDFTFMWWINWRAALGSGGFGICFELAQSGGSKYIDVGQNHGHDYLELWDGANAPTNESSLAITNNKWWHYVLRRLGNVFTIHISDEEIATYDLAVGATLTLALSGTWADLDLQGADDRVARFKGWTKYLSDTQCRIERDRADACDVDSLWINTKLLVHTDLTDSSGNGRNWSSTGSLVTFTGPTVPDSACPSAGPILIPSSPSLAPITPCAPEKQISNGGKGNAGCNTGGAGWVSSYNAALGYGTVPQYANPIAGEIVKGKRELDIWMTLHHVT